ncbi:MAG TPA: hypothetical protein VG602_08355 [Actinomycetota bacterium]|nr:hypothetical protein [Actinomycetota bacterium]
MRLATRLAILAMFVAAFGAAPATAQTAPAACQGRTIPLATDANGNPIEKLVEHTLYFHGERPVGNVDSAQELAELGASQHLTMNSTAPTGGTDKVFLHNVGGSWNTNYAMNPALAHWTGAVTHERVVCAEATAYARTTSGTLSIQLWADKGLSEPDPIVTKTATGGTANQTSKYTVNFGAVDFAASMNLIIQLIGPSGNAVVTYDSTASPGAVTYVTVEPI